jgi:crotonobetainyl-CoA:carnitine CoA-transferase CaiB-like acyl-CoA transferase
MPESILDGLTVLELGAGSRAAALAGVVLADHGARVVKVEPPEGDRLRAAAPAAFLFLNRGKESVVADLHTDEGRAAVRELAASADVLIEGFRPSTTERFGIGYEELSALNPRLVHCSITGFGRTGPYAGITAYEHVVAAKAGLFMLNGDGEFGYRPDPVFVDAPIASNGAGQYAAAAILAALTARETTGRGQHIETDLLRGISAIDYFGLAKWQLAHGRIAAPAKPLTGGRRTIVATRQSFMPCTADGRYVCFTTMQSHQAGAILRALELEHTLEDPRFAQAPAFESAEDAEEWENLIWERFRERDYAEWEPRLVAERDVPFELVRTGEEGLDHPQVRHNGDVVAVEDPEHGTIEMAGPLAHFSDTPAVIERSAPALGENAGPLVPSTAAASGPTPEHPLSGTTIVEFGYFFATPFSGALAASLGARVIKIEPLTGDPMRDAYGAPEMGATKTMEGKESIAVDLTSEDGRRILHELAARADVFVNSFRPGVAEKFGLDSAMLRAANPDLVYLHSTGYGSDGDYATRPMFAQCAMAVAGAIQRQAGEWADPAGTEGMDWFAIQAVYLPRMRGIIDGDSNAAIACCTTLMLALLHKRRAGRGQLVGRNMVAGNLWAYADEGIRYRDKPAPVRVDSELDGLNALYRLYPAAEGWVFLAAPTQGEWTELVAGLECPELTDDERFATAEARAANDAALAAELGRTFGERSAEAWEKLLVPRGVACVAAYQHSYSELASTDPVLRETGHVVEVDHPWFGPMLRHGLSAVFSETPGRIAPGVLAGQQTEALLTELGYDPARIAALVESRVVGVPG